METNCDYKIHGLLWRIKTRLKNVTICDTTDEQCPLTSLPRPKENEAKQIIKQLNTVDLSDVDAPWTSIRPLSVVPDHYPVITQRQ